MPKPSKVLESGCGAGRYVKYLHDRGWDVTGLEWAPDTVGFVKEHWPDLKVVAGDSANSPFEEDTFDGIISLGVIEHWTDGPQPPLTDIYRTLKPGAHAIVTAPCLNTVRRLKKNLWWNETIGNRDNLKRWIKGQDKPNRLKPGFKYWVYPSYGEFFEYRFTPQQFRDEVSGSGLELVEHRPIAVIDGLYHEINPKHKLANYVDYQFEVTPLGQRINDLLAKRDFTHSHHQLGIVRKPAAKDA